MADLLEASLVLLPCSCCLGYSSYHIQRSRVLQQWPLEPGGMTSADNKPACRLTRSTGYSNGFDYRYLIHGHLKGGGLAAEGGIMDFEREH